MKRPHLRERKLKTEIYPDNLSAVKPSHNFSLQPFVEKGHPIQRLFLPRMYAVIIPVVAGVILLGIIGTV